jgi:hypothetical protein
MSEKREKDRLERLGTILIVLGVAVWGVYAVLRFGYGSDAAVRDYLPYHLAGVVPGVILKRHRFFRSIVRRLWSG